MSSETITCEYDGTECEYETSIEVTEVEKENTYYLCTWECVSLFAGEKQE